ncbi:MAG: AAA family ATPase [Butyrivibrio sp.]|jgi:hypothetical protein|nr:AAA family ATPase [Butyrivibrio sp.]
MNIKQAKQEIKNTIRAYLQKDEAGEYEIPVERQRPILLIGPPGIGKTAIMEQVAQECGINLVSYTITHHTRQSAIGLPFISRRNYDGKEYSVTEYTMSEIIASVYDQIEKSGIHEGILFLDEINCVSETLAPTMLQFLQYKTFGMHRVPDGFLIVTAGNPPQYNKAVRDFDIVTLDRVKKIDVEADFDVWKEYAYKIGIHGAIMAYLGIRKEHFYSIRTETEDRYFVTARGWEDLSRMLEVYEELQIPVTKELTVQYLQDPEIAEDFATYYELYHKYRDLYRIPEILKGKYPENTMLCNAPFDEKLSIIGLLIDSLNQQFHRYAVELGVQKQLYAQLGIVRDLLKSREDAQVSGLLTGQKKQMEEELKRSMTAKLLTRQEEAVRRKVLSALSELIQKLTIEETRDEARDYELVRAWFKSREDRRSEEIRRTRDALTNSFGFLSKTFGEGQELVIFLSELTAGYYSLKFVSECGNDAYYQYNSLLLLKDRRQELTQEVRKFTADDTELTI